MSEQEKPQVSRRGFLGSTAAVAAAAAVPAVAQLATAAPAAAATRPNILLIVTDDQPKQTNWAIQKTISWLAGQGVNFTEGHATPRCAHPGAPPSSPAATPTTTAYATTAPRPSWTRAPRFSAI